MTYANPEALVETDWLAEHLQDPTVAIIEVDEDTSAYDGGHIPGAVSLDWKKELPRPPRRDFIDAASWRLLLGSKGVDDNQTLVLYGGNNNWFAAYAYWLCKLRGIEDVKLLDGGRIKWELEERPMTRATCRRARRVRLTGAERPELRASRKR